jgi:hypothetical protein
MNPYEALRHTKNESGIAGGFFNKQVIQLKT